MRRYSGLIIHIRIEKKYIDISYFLRNILKELHSDSFVHK